jgi:hypothetical protein
MSVTPEIVIVEEGGVQIVRVLEPGSVWIVDDGVPGSSAGKIGDLYLDGLTGDVYGPKTSVGWGAEPVANIAPKEVPDGGAAGDLVYKVSSANGNIGFTDAPTVDKLSFDLAAGETVANGELAWSVDEGTLELGKGGITNYIGQETMSLCRNNSNSVAIPKGTGVMFAGSLGQSGRIKVAPMVANGTLPGYVFFGVTDQIIPAGGDGYVTSFGKIRGINTNAYIEGDILWCNAVTPGTFTKVEPAAPNLKLAVAAVLSVGNNGVIMVRATSGARLKDLHDVEANGTKDPGDVLNWNGTTTRWEPSDRLTSLEQRVTALEALL